MLRPFFSFYGAKWRVARRYPAPEHLTIIEPFAGSAGYALRYPDHNIRLIDADPTIAGLWDYLIHAPETEIRALPVEIINTKELTISDEAKTLIGFWLNHGTTSPAKTPSAWMRAGQHDTSFWGEAVRERIASQQHAIRHWTIECTSYETMDNPEATWFIDPPYSTPAGRHYKVSEIDYEHLSDWAQSRSGQVIVCEQDGADWLPFQPFENIKANNATKRSKEVVWIK